MSALGPRRVRVFGAEAIGAKRNVRHRGGGLKPFGERTNYVACSGVASV